MKLGEAITLKRGYDLPSQSRVFGTVPIVSSSGTSGMHNVAKVRGPGVITGRYGTIGLVHYVEGDFWPLNTTLYVQDFKGNNPRFVKYLLEELDFHQFSDKAAVPGINRNHVHEAAVVLPSVDEQEGIAEFLAAFERRIENLRRTNETLEEIAQALFRSWFVDFDPVRAKAEGRETVGICSAAAALFPSELEESELGQIPKGWSTTSVYLLAKYVNGAAYKAFEPNAEQKGLPIIKIAELKAGVTRSTAYSDVAMPEKIRIDTGEILFSWSGNPDTSIDTFVWSGGPAWLNQHIFRVVVERPHERSFVLTALKYLRPLFAELARNKQTTGLGHVTVGDLKEARAITPPSDVLVAWSEIVDPIWERSLCNQMQIQLLSSLRDTLIPRLISGKTRLSEFDELIRDPAA